MRALAGRPATRPLTAALLGLVAAYAVAIMFAMALWTYDVWGAFVIGPALIAVSVPMMFRAARREDDPRFVKLLAIALVLKLGSSLVRYAFAFGVYGGVADATGYDGAGERIAEQFWNLDFHPDVRRLDGTGVLEIITGIVYSFTGPSRIGGFFVFAWFAFWGVYLWYRAFTIAVPDGRTSSYARFVFFLPTLLYWPSSIGKDSWMTLAIGVCALGIANALTGRVPIGLAGLALGMWLGGIVRPHVSLLIVIAAVLAYVVRPSPARARTLGPVTKSVVVGMLVCLTAVFASMSASFFNVDGVNVDAVSDVLEYTNTNTTQGGSGYDAQVVRSPLDVPVALVTVLFRPFPHEARNPQLAVQSVECLFLLAVAVARRRSILGSLRGIRRRPFVAFAAFYTLFFCLAFSSFGNFGILARERSQMFPAFLVLLCMPDRRRETGSAQVLPDEVLQDA